MLFDCCTYRIPTRLAWHVIPFPDYVFFLPSPFTESAAWMANPTIQVRVARQFNFMVPFLFTAARQRLVSLRTCQVSSRIGGKWNGTSFRHLPPMSFLSWNIFWQWWLNSKFGDWSGDSFIKQQLTISAKASLIRITYAYVHQLIFDECDVHWLTK